MLQWIGFIIFWVPISIFALVLLRLLALEIFTGEVKSKTAKRAFILVALTVLVKVAASTILLYYELNTNDFGKYFLAGGNSYFGRTVLYMIEPSLWAFAMALGFLLIIWLIRKIFKSPMFNFSDTMVIMLSVLIIGVSNVVVMLVASFVLMVIVQLIWGIKQKNLKNMRLRISPFLLFTSLIILILSNFGFYQQFLGLVRLQ